MSPLEEATKMIPMGILSPSITRTAGYIIALPVLFVVLYYAYRTFYNTFLHPLRKYPGPWLDGATYIPYMYYLVRGSRCYYHMRLHEKYCDVVRISPGELSYRNPQAWKDIYTRRSGHALLPKEPTHYTPANGKHNIVTAPHEYHSRIRKNIANAKLHCVITCKLKLKVHARQQCPTSLYFYDLHLTSATPSNSFHYNPLHPSPFLSQSSSNLNIPTTTSYDVNMSKAKRTPEDEIKHKAELARARQYNDTYPAILIKRQSQLLTPNKKLDTFGTIKNGNEVYKDYFAHQDEIRTIFQKADGDEFRSRWKTKTTGLPEEFGVDNCAHYDLLCKEFIAEPEEDTMTLLDLKKHKKAEADAAAAARATDPNSTSAIINRRRQVRDVVKSMGEHGTDFIDAFADYGWDLKKMSKASQEKRKKRELTPEHGESSQKKKMRAEEEHIVKDELDEDDLDEDELDEDEDFSQIQ